MTEPPCAPKVQKKRGRKKKSEVLAEKIEAIIQKQGEEEDDSVSRRGRRRRRVNYFELANPDNAEELPLQLLEQEKFFAVIASTPKRNKRAKLDAGETSLESNGESSKSDPNLSGETSIKATKSAKQPEANKSDSREIPSNNAQEDQQGIDRKYNYTGETVKMMNTLFNFIVKKEKSDESNDTVSSSTVENVNSSTPSVGSRQKKKKVEGLEVGKEETEESAESVTCAVCNTEIEKPLWRHHKQRYHNNLAWRVGEPPLDLSNQNFVMQTLSSLYKKKKPLYCDSCGNVKKSVVGFLSHRSQCSKSQDQIEAVKISCSICGRRMLPVSLSTHMKTIHSKPKQEKHEEPPTSTPNTLSNKRNAAKNAVKIIENVTKNDVKGEYFTENLDYCNADFAKVILQEELQKNQVIECKFKCNYLAASFEDALEHSYQCIEKPENGYICKKCLFTTSHMKELMDHIENIHNVSLVEESVTPEKSDTLPCFIISHVKKSERVLFEKAFAWTLKFHEDNFSDMIFGNFINSTWGPILGSSLVPDYLPKLKESCDVARQFVTSFITTFSDTYIYKRYGLFESELHEDNKHTLFCGGPISALAWLPIPFNKLGLNQVLAVSVLNCPDDKYITSENYTTKTVIQFWNFGCLNNKQQPNEKAEFECGIAYDFGPIWHMEWCPSGCFNDADNKRSGLLAVAGSSTAVDIFTIPTFSNTNRGFFYKPKPVARLLLQQPNDALLGGYKYYPTKISWSKSSGHSHIAVGYSHGFVAIFNLNLNSLFSQYEDNGVTCFLPIKCFQPHFHSVSALALYHLNGGSRWLLTGSFDRNVYIWDLNNCVCPLWNVRRNIVTDGCWLTNWLANLTAADEGTTILSYLTTLLNQARDYFGEPNISMAPSHSTISSISGSDWLNGFLHGNSVGEIVAIFPHQVLNTPGSKVLKTKRMLFGYTSLIEKDVPFAERSAKQKLKKKKLQNPPKQRKKSASNSVKIKTEADEQSKDSLFCDEPIIYEEAQDKYGLLFCDNTLRSYNDFPKNAASELTALSKNFGTNNPNLYPLNAINKIVFNPNRQASLYYATGYQAGFVRVSWMEFLKQDLQIQ